MSDKAIIKVGCNVSNIFYPSSEMFGALCRDGFRLLIDHIIHDRKIMGSQIPHDIDVVLEKTEIDSCRIIEEKSPQFLGIDDLPDLSHSTSE